MRKFAWLERAGQSGWRFEFAHEKWVSDEDLDYAIDEMESDPSLAEGIFRSLIKRYPYHFDAYHHLALMLSIEGKGREALELRRKAVDLGLGLFPRSFDLKVDKLDWEWLENRPFLRVYAGLATDYRNIGDVQKALEIYERILSLSPGDNLGCRFSAIWCRFALMDPDGVLHICSKYPREITPEITYGKVLALFQKGRRQKSEEALGKAIEGMPRVALELTRDKHRKAAFDMMGGVVVGGANQASLYWAEYGTYWENTPGSIELVRHLLRSNHHRHD